MNRHFWVLLPLLGLWLASPAFAGDKDQIKCGVNQDRVWVYDALTTFDIGARLKCGETVEIVSRVKGYVKIRSASGAEGYVPESALPDLPPLPDPDDKPATATGRAPTPSSSGATSLAATAKATSAAPKPPVVTAVATSQPSVARPAPVAIAAPASPLPTPVPVSAPTPVALVGGTSATPTAAPAASDAKVISAPPKRSVNASVPASSPALAPVAPVATSSAASTPAQANDTRVAGAPAKSANATASSTKYSKPAAARTTTPPAAPPPPMTPVPPKAPSIPVDEAKLETAASSPANGPVREPLRESVREIAPPPRAAMVKTAAEAPIDSEYPDTQPENESADPACHTFFSAYGLSPSQFKWLAANRRKLYPSICPAPDLGTVDFVVLFTHDSDSYNVAMPTPVHTDRSGFSDFNPLTTIDTALLSAFDADHARREYVWVFQMRRGGFDPVKFSPRRRPQFSTESKGAARAIEDALDYLQGQGPRLEASK